jgi:hypothetical protein
MLAMTSLAPCRRLRGARSKGTPVISETRWANRFWTGALRWRSPKRATRRPRRRGLHPTLVTPGGSTQSPVQMHTALQIRFPPRSIPDAHSQNCGGSWKEKRRRRARCGNAGRARFSSSARALSEKAGSCQSCQCVLSWRWSREAACAGRPAGKIRRSQSALPTSRLQKAERVAQLRTRRHVCRQRSSASGHLNLCLNPADWVHRTPSRPIIVCRLLRQQPNWMSTQQLLNLTRDTKGSLRWAC